MSLFDSLFGEPEESQFRLEAGRFTISSDTDDFSVFVPEAYEPAYGYPLLVWLHSAGATDEQLLRVMPQVSLRNYIAVAPLGIATRPANASKRVYDWPQTHAAIEQAIEKIHAAISSCVNNYHVNRERIFLAGFDSGATMALRLAFREPEKFAGVAAICGRFPKGHRPLANLVALRRLDVVLMVGKTCPKNHLNEMCQGLRLLHAAGIPARLRQYPCGHNIMPVMLRDLNYWIMEQIDTSTLSRASARRHAARSSGSNPTQYS